MQRNEPKQNSIETGEEFVTYDYERHTCEDMLKKASLFRKQISKRRSVREYSHEDFPVDIVYDAIATACSAPSGANKQPWHFCLIKNAELKARIREAAEEEEYKSYTERMNDQWLKDIEPLGTNHVKPFIEIAPYLIVIFKKPYDIVDGKRIPNYYVNESVGIASGFLIAALQNAGLATLTHTPSPMNFLHEILERPENERAFLLLPVGFAKLQTKVPNISRKAPSEVMTQYF
ncbi:MAG: nitroreductase family protein [Bacteroidota bacterium]